MHVVTLATKAVERAAVYFPFLTRVLRMYYKKIVENEIDLGKINSRDKVLCIGGGPLPCTALEIAEKTGAKVEVIDNDICAVKAARRLINKLNMSDRVLVAYGDGQEVDTSKFSVVHVAMQARPHEKILKNVWQKSRSGTRILLRRPNDSLEVFYSNLPEGCYYPACSCARQNNCTIKETLLITKVRGRVKHEKNTPYHGRAAADAGSFLAG